MDRLPAELIHVIFLFLKAPDIGNFRLASKFYANAGRSRLFYELHLMFTPESFERLHAISSDPELACHVTSLFYEADTLPALRQIEDCQRVWESNIFYDGVPPELECRNQPRPRSSSEGAHRAYNFQLEELKIDRFEKFRGYSKEQNTMRKDSYYAEKIRAAIFHLPNLEEVFLSFEQWARPRTNAMRMAYSDCSVVPSGHNSWTEPRGVPQMLSLCLASALTEKKLKTLWGGIIDWKFLKQSDAVFEDLQKGVQNVEELVLEFSTCPGGEGSNLHSIIQGEMAMAIEISECAEYLKDGRLQKFLAAAPNLRLLDLRFHSIISSLIEGFPADLSYVVGKHRWERLADVTLSFLSSTAEDLTGFCESHAMTLQRLVISKISLFEGSWLPTFQKIRRLLRLQRVRICGRLEALDECWDFPAIRTRGETTMSRVVQEYLLQGGDGPLLDLKQYIDLSKVELNELRD